MQVKKKKRKEGRKKKRKKENTFQKGDLPRICRQKLFFLMKRSVPLPLSKNHRTKSGASVRRISPVLSPHQCRPATSPLFSRCPDVGTAQGRAHGRGFQVVQRHCNIPSTHLWNGRALETWLTMLHYRNYNKRQKLKKKSLFKILQTVATNLQQY